MNQMGKRRVLIVEDMDAIRKIMAEQLRKVGFEQIWLAENSRRALELLEEKLPDIILLDWKLPDGDGDILLKAIRAKPELVNIPVVLVTANAHRDLILQAIDAGVSDIIVKPFTSKRLQQGVIQALSGRSSLWSAVRPRSVSEGTAVAKNTVTEHPPQDANKPTVLLVDDCSDNLALLAGLLRPDYRVLFAKDGATALKLSRVHTPDLVLLDIMMPEMDGFEVLKRLRQQAETEDCAVVMLSALQDDANKIKGLTDGALDYLTKPVQPELLQLKLKMLLAQRNAHRALQASYDEMLNSARIRDSADELLLHDLKSPLSAVAQLSRKLLGRLSSEKGQSRDTCQQLQQLNELVKHSLETLDLRQELYLIETGRFSLQAESVSLRPMLRSLLDSMHISFHHKKLLYYISPDDSVSMEPHKEAEGNWQVMGDPRLCRCLLQNLLKNAFEAAPLKTKVVVNLSREGESVLIRISNPGSIAAELQPRLFQRYSSNKRGGCGLGCYSARMLARAQGGDITLESSAPEVCFCVSLPAAP